MLRKFAMACIWICESSCTKCMFHRSFGIRPTYVTQSWHQVVWYCAFAVGGESSCTSCRAFKDTSWTIWWGSSPKREFFPKGKGRELHLLFSRVVTCSGLINQKYSTINIMGWVIVVTLPRTSSLWTTQGLLFCPFFPSGNLNLHRARRFIKCPWYDKS